MALLCSVASTLLWQWSEKLLCHFTVLFLQFSLIILSSSSLPAPNVEVFYNVDYPWQFIVSLMKGFARKDMQQCSLSAPGNCTSSAQQGLWFPVTVL